MEYTDYFLKVLATAETDTQNEEELKRATEAGKLKLFNEEILKFWELFRVIHENYKFGTGTVNGFFWYLEIEEKRYLNSTIPFLHENIRSIDLWFTAKVNDECKFEYYVQERESTAQNLYFADFETFIRFISIRVMKYKAKK